jgi:hypothetical protein
VALGLPGETLLREVVDEVEEYLLEVKLRALVLLPSVAVLLFLLSVQGMTHPLFATEHAHSLYGATQPHLHFQ